MTQDAYEKALRAWEAESYGERNQEERKAIRAHVDAQAAEIERLKKYLDMEERDNERTHKLCLEKIAELEKQNTTLQSMVRDGERQFKSLCESAARWAAWAVENDALKARIEGAQPLWIAYHPEHGYSWDDDIKRQEPDLSDLSRWASLGWTYRKVHCVPVEEKKECE